jgi:hypothetical protein
MTKQKVRSNMSIPFAEAWIEYRDNMRCPTYWLTWIGQPMLYDGALFVERDREQSIQTTE